MSFAEAGRAVIEGAASGLYQAGTVLMATSQQLVPVDTGTLKRSGMVEEPVVNGDSIEITVGYGYGGEYEGRATENNPDGKGYGFWVHERIWSHSMVKTREVDGVSAEYMSVKPIYHKPPTQAKFLEVPAQALGPELGSFVQEGIRARLEGR